MVTHRQLPGSYPRSLSMRSIVSPVGGSPMSARKFSKVSHRSLTVMPRAPYRGHARSRGFVAALNKRRPTGVDGCGFPSEIVPVLVIKMGDFLAVKTSATGDASSDIADRGDGSVAAITAAFPDELLSLPTGETDSEEASETLAGDILESGHDGSFDEQLRQEAARRFSGGPSRVDTIFCGRLQ